MWVALSPLARPLFPLPLAGGASVFIFAPGINAPKTRLHGREQTSCVVPQAAIPHTTMDGLREEHTNPLAQTNPFHRVQSGSVATCEAQVSVDVADMETNTTPLSPIWTPFGRVLRNSSGSILSRHTTTVRVRRRVRIRGAKKSTTADDRSFLPSWHLAQPRTGS